MKAKKKLLLIAAAAALAMCVAIGMIIASAAETNPFEGADVDENGNLLINENNIPDEVFRGYISDNFDIDKDSALSVDECAAVTEIDVSVEDGEEYVYDLTGIKYFENLEVLNCTNNILAEIDITHNQKLESLNCSLNIIGGLDVSKNTLLKYLDCSLNYISELNVSANTALTYLNCSSNEISNLDVSANTALTDLDCNTNKLSTLDVSANKSLSALTLYDNPITTLDISNTSIAEFIYDDNETIESITASNMPSLTSFYCVGCSSLVSLDLSGDTALTDLDCSYTEITSIDLSDNTALTTLNCYHGKLTSLDLSSNTELKSLYCDNNELTELNISACNKLIEMNCEGNHLTSLTLSVESIDNMIFGSQTTDKVLHAVKHADGKYYYDLYEIVGENSFTISRAFGKTTGEGDVFLNPTKDDVSCVVSSDALFEQIEYTIRVGGQGEMYVLIDNIELASTEPLTSSDSSAEFPADDAGYYVDVTLDVEKDDAEAKAAADKQFETKYEIYVAYDVSLLKNGVEIQPKSTLNIRIPIPAELDKSALAVYHIKSDGTSESVEFKIDGDYVAFTVDSLSAYVLVDTSSEIKPVTPPSGGDETTSGSDETTSDPATSDPPTSDPATSDPATSDPATTDPATSDPATSEPAATDPVGTEPAETEPATDPVTEPATDPVTEPVTDPETEPSGSDTGAAEPPETGDGGFNFAVLALVVICASSAAAIVVVRKLRAK